MSKAPIYCRVCIQITQVSQPYKTTCLHALAMQRNASKRNSEWKSRTSNSGFYDGLGAPMLVACAVPAPLSDSRRYSISISTEFGSGRTSSHVLPLDINGDTQTLLSLTISSVYREQAVSSPHRAYHRVPIIRTVACAPSKARRGHYIESICASPPFVASGVPFLLRHRQDDAYLPSSSGARALLPSILYFRSACA